MIALLRKDRFWLLTSLLLGATVFTSIFWDRRPLLLWIGGERRNTNEILLAWWICAGVFGLYAGLRDRLQGTREYLLQRPVRPQYVFCVRWLGCLLVMTVGALLPFLLMWARPFASENRVLWEIDRLWIFYALSTSMWMVFALGMYAATVPASKISAVFQTAVIGVPLLFIAWRVRYPLGDALEVSPWFYIAVQATLAGLLLLLGAWHFARGQDRDRDISPRLKACNLALVSTCAMLLAAIGVSELQREAYQDLWRPYRRQSVREWEDGHFERLRTRTDLEGSHYEVLDPDGGWVQDPTVAAIVERARLMGLGGPLVYDEGEPAAPRYIRHALDPHDHPWPDVERRLEPRVEFERHGHALGGIRVVVRHIGAGRHDDGYLQMPAGVVELYCFAEHGPGERRRATPWKRTFARADGAPFSLRTQFMACGWPRPLLAVDLDGEAGRNSVWVLQDHEPGSCFTRISLPGEGPTSLGHLDRDTGRFIQRWTWHLPNNVRLAAKQAGIVYVWEDGAFEPAAQQPEPEPKKWWRAPAPGWASRSEHILDDPLVYHFLARDAAGDVRYEVTLRPNTPEQRWDLGLVYACTVVRSPVLTVASLGLEPPGVWPFDPLITYGGRPWLIALNLAFAGILAFLTRWRLRRLGADRATLRLWTTLILVGGLPVYVVFWFVERKRAYRPVHVAKPEEIPPLLIQTV